MMHRTPFAELVKPYLRPMTPLPTRIKLRGNLRLPIEALLCDVYGTLFISGCGDLSTTRQQTMPLDKIEALLRRYRISIAPGQLVQKLHESIEHHHQEARDKGINYPEVRIENIWPHILNLKDKAEIERFAVEYEMVVNPAWPMPNMKELLSVCLRHRIHLGIISNAQFFTPYLFEWLLGKSMGQLGFQKELILFSFEWDEAKPSKRLFDTAVQRLGAMGIAPQRAAYIGNDTSKDILPAAAVGMQTILFAGDARSLRIDDNASSTDRDIPDLVVTDLQQLIKYFER